MVRDSFFGVKGLAGEDELWAVTHCVNKYKKSAVPYTNHGVERLPK